MHHFVIRAEENKIEYGRRGGGRAGGQKCGKWIISMGTEEKKNYVCQVQVLRIMDSPYHPILVSRRSSKQYNNDINHIGAWSKVEWGCDDINLNLSGWAFNAKH